MQHKRAVPMALLILLGTFGVGACSEQNGQPDVRSSTATPVQVATGLPARPPVQPPAEPPVATEPAQLATELSADEQTLHDPSSSEAALAAAAHRQQLAYRALGRHPEWDSTVRAAIPASLLGTYDRNVDARRHLTALGGGEVKDTVPAWRINPPTPADALRGYSDNAQAASGVGWNYLAAINFVETDFGRIAGTSNAGAQGPMQFLPSTFAGYGDGGDIQSPHDSIMAAGRYLAANGFADDHDRAIFRYNNSNNYVAAVEDYAALIADDPTSLGTLYRWDVYYLTTSGDVLLPVGYVENERVPVADYLAAHPQ
jgi:Transglycosylase SLT domain